MKSSSRIEVDSAQAGDIVATAGLKQVATGDTLADQKDPIRFESVHFPEPVIYIAIEPKSTSDNPKLLKSLNKLQAEDPSFSFKEDHDTAQLLIGGMGELHLEVVVDRLRREFRVKNMHQKLLIGNQEIL